MQSEPSSGIKLTAYSCICWLFHRIYYCHSLLESSNNVSGTNPNLYSIYAGCYFPANMVARTCRWPLTFI